MNSPQTPPIKGSEQGPSKSAVSNLFRTRDRFHERRVFHLQGLRGAMVWGWFKRVTLTVHFISVIVTSTSPRSSGVGSWRLETTAVHWRNWSPAAGLTGTVFSAELTSLFNTVSRSSLLSLALAGRNCCCGHLSPRKPSSTADWFMPGRALSAGSSPTPGRRGGRYRDSKASPGPWRPPEREEAFRSC